MNLDDDGGGGGRGCKGRGKRNGSASRLLSFPSNEKFCDRGTVEVIVFFLEWIVSDEAYQCFAFSILFSSPVFLLLLLLLLLFFLSL